MKYAFILITFFCLLTKLNAQNVYTIKADSVKLTNCDSTELIIENHTQNIPGFLFNTGKGRTIFKRGAQKLNDSSYLIGGDTLKFNTNGWVHGGNSFGATGIIGTLDNHHLDFYINGLGNVRLDTAGNLLVGTVTDNGDRFQVNGSSSFSGNVNIGSATVTSGGALVGTNAILYNRFISQYRNFQGNDPYMAQLQNVLYDYSDRFITTTTTAPDGIITIDIVIPPDELETWAPGIVYPGGSIGLSFWNGGIPQSVSVMMYDNNSLAWRGPFSSSTNIGFDGAGFFQIPIIGSFNYANEIKITITPAPSTGINLQDIEYVLDNGPQGLINGLPLIGKGNNEHMYGFLLLKNAGVDNVRLSPLLGYPNFFLNSVLVGSSTDNGGGNILQVTGNISTTGSLGIGTTTPATQLHTTGAVRFAGLTNDNSRTRIVVSDASGNLFYRDASSLASNDPIHSSLAVNGTITAQRFKLSQTGWPDYVFDSNYRLLPMEQLEKYIKQNHHLPGISSGAEVEKKGVDVGDSQAALLKKIEELTLYNIEQAKRTDALTKEMGSLKAEIAELKRLLTINPVK